MIRRAVIELAFVFGLTACCLTAGCDGVTTGPTPESHDQDKTAGHLNNPAGGPNSPLAKTPRKPGVPAK